VGNEVLEARVACDALLLKEALAQGRLDEARALYRGRFLEGADEDLSEELEEWVWSTREALAEALYGAHLREAEKRFALGLEEEGEALWRAALALPGVAEVAEEAPRRELLPPEARRAFYGVAFLGPVQAGEVLGVSAEALELLWKRGLLTSTGEPTFRPTLTLEARRVALELARRLPLPEAAPYYRLSLPLWQEEDAARGKRALLDLARKEVEENPKEALELLLELAPDLEVLLLRARVLERLGRYAEALSLLEEVPESPGKSALKGVLAFRMGERPKAAAEAERALEGDAYAQGEGWNLLGLLHHGRGALPGGRRGLQPGGGALPAGGGKGPPPGGPGEPGRGPGGAGPGGGGLPGGPGGGGGPSPPAGPPSFEPGGGQGAPGPYRGGRGALPGGFGPGGRGGEPGGHGPGLEQPGGPLPPPRQEGGSPEGLREGPGAGPKGGGTPPSGDGPGQLGGAPRGPGRSGRGHKGPGGSRPPGPGPALPGPLAGASRRSGSVQTPFPILPSCP
jgi:hypothetical protein